MSKARQDTVAAVVADGDGAVGVHHRGIGDQPAGQVTDHRPSTAPRSPARRGSGAAGRWPRRGRAGSRRSRSRALPVVEEPRRLRRDHAVPAVGLAGVDPVGDPEGVVGSQAPVPSGPEEAGIPHHVDVDRRRPTAGRWTVRPGCSGRRSASRSGSSTTNSQAWRSPAGTGVPGREPAKSLVTRCPSGRITNPL